MLISVWCFFYWLKGVIKFNCGLSYNSCCVCVNVIIVMVVVCCCRATCISRRQLSTVTSCSTFASETGSYSSRWHWRVMNISVAQLICCDLYYHELLIGLKLIMVYIKFLFNNSYFFAGLLLLIKLWYVIASLQLTWIIYVKLWY